MDSLATKEIVRFYFSFNDPYSFLIAPIVKSLSHSYKIDIEYIPLSGYDREGLFSEDEAVKKYFQADSQRFAKKSGRKLIYKNETQESHGVCLLKHRADEEMLGVKFINLVLSLRWVSEKDLSSVDDVAEGLKFLEFDPADVAEGMTTEKYKEKQDEATALAKSEGVISLPFITFRGVGYMGAERLDYLEDTLRADQSLIVHHDATYGVIKAVELKEKLDKKEPLLVLDVRFPKDYSAGHIPGANCLTAKIVLRNKERLDRDWKIVVVDDGGVLASDTAFALATEGFKNVSTISGGIDEWKWEMESGLDNWQDRLKPLK